MRKFLLFPIIFFYVFTASGQKKILNQKIFDSAAKQEILIGYCNRSGLGDSVFSVYFLKEYDSYKVDPEIKSQLYPLLQDIHITIIMGTWCSDSREQVPRFYRLFDDLEHTFADPEIICVDKQKKAGTIPLDPYHLEKVPTFIVYYRDKELGRIIETPKTTIEKDLLEILKK